jgi:hypothetical protein
MFAEKNDHRPTAPDTFVTDRKSLFGMVREADDLGSGKNSNTENSTAPKPTDISYSKKNK